MARVLSERAEKFTFTANSKFLNLVKDAAERQGMNTSDWVRSWLRRGLVAEGVVIPETPVPLSDDEIVSPIGPPGTRRKTG